MGAVTFDPTSSTPARWQQRGLDRPRHRGRRARRRRGRSCVAHGRLVVDRGAGPLEHAAATAADRDGDALARQRPRRRGGGLPLLAADVSLPVSFLARPRLGRCSSPPRGRGDARPAPVATSRTSPPVRSCATRTTRRAPVIAPRAFTASRRLLHQRNRRTPVEPSPDADAGGSPGRRARDEARRDAGRSCPRRSAWRATCP